MMIWSLRTATLFWPGFRKAWTKSDAQAVIVALLFAWLSILALVGNWYWVDWYPHWFTRLLTCGLIGAAIYQGFRALLFGETQKDGGQSKDAIIDREQNFRLAQECYLQAGYFEAEQYLLKNLASNPNDIESALLLASVYRRSGKFSDAIHGLNQLQLRENAAHWLPEIHQEKERAIRAKRQSSTVPPPKA